MYKESYDIRRVSHPEDIGKPGMKYCVYHIVPLDFGTCLAFAGKRFFSTLEEAERYRDEKVSKIKEREREKNEHTETENKSDRKGNKSP